MEKDQTGVVAVSPLEIVGILAIFCTMGEFTILTPSIAAFSHHFADTPTTTIMLANSITGMISVPVSILSGSLLPRVGFRRSAIIGVLIMSLAGASPFLFPDTQDYSVVIASRMAVGVGLGILFPVGNATIIAFFEGERRSRLLGLGVTVQFLFALVYTTVAGFLTEIGWNYSFLTYLVGLVPLAVVVAFMPEARSFALAESSTSSSALYAIRCTPRAVWGYALFALAVWTCVTTVQVITSTVLDERGLAGSAESALVINCCGLGSIVCGLAFPFVLRLFRSRLFGAAATMAVAGIVPCLLASDTLFYAAGLFLLGFGGSAFFTAAQNAAGNVAPKSCVPFASGLMTAMMSLGPFISPYLFVASMGCIPPMGTNAVFPVLIGMGTICAVIGFAHPMKALAKERESRKGDQNTQ